MHAFDYSFLKNKLPGELLNTAGIIYDQNARSLLRAGENPALFEKLRQSAMIDSVEGSNAIEGIVTTKARSKKLLFDEDAPKTHEEEEILGYRNALREIYENAAALGLSEDLIRHFHFEMLSATSRDAGQYKRTDNFILEKDTATGARSVRFRPVTAAHTPEAMAQMLLAYYDARQDSAVSGLLLTACFVADFLCIHPFLDGNGRVSRLLTTLLLLQDGFEIGRYISVDKKINEYKAGYYDALKKASAGWHGNANDYTPFMVFLMQMLYRCYKDLDLRFFEEEAAALPKHKRVEALLQNAFAPVSKAEIAERLPEVSVTTIERVLGDMVKDGRVEKIGANRNARYMRRK